MEDDPDLQALRQRQADADASYNALLSALDALSEFALPAERLPARPGQMARLNELWDLPQPELANGLRGRLRGIAWNTVSPALARQRDFNSVLVQLLNGQVEEDARLFAELRALVAALMRYLQRLLPTLDARDRVATALATTRAELVLEAFDRRQESLARRLEGLLALRARQETQGEQLRALETALRQTPPAAAVARAAVEASDDALYVAFEGCYRGSREAIREKLSGYLAHFAAASPVLDLGCGRGEFLELLQGAGIAARGVDGNAANAADCQARGLAVTHGDLLEYLAAQADASVGGVFAAQVAEHLPPAVLQRMLREAHRVLRGSGMLLLETVNPRSVVGLLEVFNRDLTHERPLHPDTLSFLAAAAGFTEVRVELCTPVLASDQLQPVPTAGLPEAAARTLNENVARLNGLLYGPQEYVLLARR